MFNKIRYFVVGFLFIGLFAGGFSSDVFSMEAIPEVKPSFLGRVKESVKTIPSTMFYLGALWVSSFSDEDEVVEKYETFLKGSIQNSFEEVKANLAGDADALLDEKTEIVPFKQGPKQIGKIFKNFIARIPRGAKRIVLAVIRHKKIVVFAVLSGLVLKAFSWCEDVQEERPICNDMLLEYAAHPEESARKACVWIIGFFNSWEECIFSTPRRFKLDTRCYNVPICNSIASPLRPLSNSGWQGCPDNFPSDSHEQVGFFSEDILQEMKDFLLNNGTLHDYLSYFFPNHHQNNTLGSESDSGFGLKEFVLGVGSGSLIVVGGVFIYCCWGGCKKAVLDNQEVSGDSSSVESTESYFSNTLDSTYGSDYSSEARDDRV